MPKNTSSAQKYITSFRPSAKMPETIAFATELGADILYQGEKSFAAMVDDLQRHEIELFMLGQE